MNEQIRGISSRIRELREVIQLTPEEVAEKVGVGLAEYLNFESGAADIPIGVLYGVAGLFQVDPTELLTGDSPRMDDYTIVRSGQGVKVERYAGYSFSALASNYKNRDMNPMIVTLTKSDTAELVSHSGQEFNLVLSGSIRLVIGPHSFDLASGDSAYFNPMIPHGQRALTAEAKFLTVINE